MSLVSKCGRVPLAYLAGVGSADAQLVLGLAVGDAAEGAFHQEGRDAVLGLAVGVRHRRFGEHGEEVGLPNEPVAADQCRRRHQSSSAVSSGGRFGGLPTRAYGAAVGDPDLVAVEDPVVAVQRQFSARLDGGGVGAAVGLRQAKRRRPLAGGQARQVLLLLLVAAGDQQALEKHDKQTNKQVERNLISRHLSLSNIESPPPTFKPMDWWAARTTAMEPLRAVISQMRANSVALRPRPPYSGGICWPNRPRSFRPCTPPKKKQKN